MLDRSDGPLASERPDLAQEGLEPGPVFVHCPQLDGRLGKGGRHRAQQRTQPLLKGGLGLRISPHMARAGHAQTGA
jgi:hypothetical protein